MGKRQEQSKLGQESSMGQIIGSSFWAIPPCLASPQGLGKNWSVPSGRRTLLPLSSGFSPVLRTQGQDGPRRKRPIQLQQAQPQTSHPVRTSCPSLLLFSSLCSVLLAFFFPQLCFLFSSGDISGETFRITGFQSQLSYFLSSCTLAKLLSLPKTQPLNL